MAHANSLHATGPSHGSYQLEQAGSSRDVVTASGPALPRGSGHPCEWYAHDAHSLIDLGVRDVVGAQLLPKILARNTQHLRRTRALLIGEVKRAQQVLAL